MRRDRTVFMDGRELPVNPNPTIDDPKAFARPFTIEGERLLAPARTSWT